MASGRLVTIDRLGRAGKQLPLGAGAAATLGRDAACDVRVLHDDVWPQHAVVVVHTNQTVVRNVCPGETLVNGRAVGVAALRHGDLITVGGRTLRWQYDDPQTQRPLAPEPALYNMRGVRTARRATCAVGETPAANTNALQLHHRASMPGNAGGKQVAIVQPQRRDTTDNTDKSSSSSSSPRSPRAVRPPAVTPPTVTMTTPTPTPTPRRSVSRITKVYVSRSGGPRFNVRRGRAPRSSSGGGGATRGAGGGGGPGLRMAVLRRTHAKIRQPDNIDPTKAAALLLMAGGRRSAPPHIMQTQTTKVSEEKSPSAPSSPRKSALKDPTAKRGVRKGDSIKFDLSNLIRDTTPEDDITLRYDDSPPSVPSLPSPRRSLHSKYSRSSRMLEQAGSPLKAYNSAPEPQNEPSPRSRSSLRGSIMLSALNNNTANTEYSRKSTRADRNTNATVTLSPRSVAETYSIVDLVSVDSNESANSQSVYGSVGSTRSSSILFGTPNTTRNTRSTIEPSLVTSSTPYVSRSRVSTRSKSSPNVSIKQCSPNKTVDNTSRRSRSLTMTTPENSEETKKHISINSTKISRASKTFSRLDDSDLQFINSVDGDDDSPRSSRRPTRGNVSQITKSPSPRKASPRKSISINATADSVLINSHGSSNVTVDESVLLRSPGSQSVTLVNSPRRPGSRNVTAEVVNSPRRSPGSRNVTAEVVNSPRRPGSRNVTGEVVNSPRTTGSKNVSVESVSRKSPGSKNVSVENEIRASRSRLTLDVTQTASQDEGTITPENVTGPEEIGTPVLSIQSLLDSSQSSFISQNSQKSPKKKSPLTKRKTIGVIRSGKKMPRSNAKSKSFTASVRKSLRSLRLSKENDVTITDEEKVTPKSEVKLVQEAVKNKHSTARKPQSKRSIIDNLNESDIVKQLFNSPVKRKLSQSMTEFSRKKLFEDEDDVQAVRRPTRNTVALSGRTPDISLSGTSDRITPDRFVSPVATPESSPNLTGIRRLYAKRSPDNDLRNVTGVKKLLRTPRLRRSPKNDLTDVAGVKALFGRSPRNRLTDINVKRVFATSPKNELRRVSGVNKLFRSQKERAEPTNDLSDVRGVRQLYRRQPEPQYHDISGVKELFDESNTSHRDPEALFDQLIGRPPIKAVYSKSLIAKRPKKKKTPTKSLHASIDLITNNVEEWLEQELQKRLHKDKEEQKKSNVTRELQRLATDTVEGVTPIRKSRVRNSSMRSPAVAAGRKQSASQVYSARKLPIKKRSLAEKSLNAKEMTVNKSNMLPIKKRAVVHSTPVKGRYDATLTMNASELGRVSPITFIDKTNVEPEPTPMDRSPPAKTSPKRKGKIGTKVDIVESPKVVIEVRASRQTRKKAEPIAKTSPKPKRTTRGRNANAEVRQSKSKATTSKQEISNTEAGDAKAASKKKAPIKTAEPALKSKAKSLKENVGSPKSPKKTRGRSAARGDAENVQTQEKVTRRTRNTNAKVESPPKTAAKGKGKGKPAEIVKTPIASPVKKTRGAQKQVKPAPPAKARSQRSKIEAEVPNAKKRRNSLVITKKPPVLSPKATAGRATRKNAKAVESPERAGKQTVPIENKVKTPAKTRAKLVSKPSPQLKAKRMNTRNAYNKTKQESPKESQAKAAENKNDSEETNKIEPKRRGRKTVEVVEPPKASPGTKRIRKAEAAVNSNVTTDEPAAKRGRNAKSSVIEKPATPKRSRGRKTVEVVEPPKEVSQRRGRKRKSESDEQSGPAKVTRTTSSRRKAQTTPEKPNTPEQGRLKPKAASSKQKAKELKTRGRKTTEASTTKKAADKTSGKKQASRSATSSNSKRSPVKAATTTRSRRR